MPNPYIMKRIILIAFAALFCLTASAQELYIDNDAGDVYITQVVQTDMTQDDIVQQIIAYDILDDLVIHNNMVVGNIKPAFLDYAAAGYSRMKLPLYLVNDRFTGRIIFRFKEGRYRYDAFNLRFKDNQGYVSSLYSFSDSFGFDIATRLILQHIQSITTFYPIDNEW